MAYCSWEPPCRQSMSKKIEELDDVGMSGAVWKLAMAPDDSD